MNAELEELLKRYDDFRQASGEEARHLHDIYQARLDDVLQRFPNLSRLTLQRMIDRAYRRCVVLRTSPRPYLLVLERAYERGALISET